MHGNQLTVPNLKPPQLNNPPQSPIIWGIILVLNIFVIDVIFSPPCTGDKIKDNGVDKRIGVGAVYKCYISCRGGF